jgi:arsenite methyltransferase
MKKYLNNKFNSALLPDMCDELELWSAPFGLKLLDCINYRNNMTALDIGFGTGFPLIELAMRLGESSTVFGIDPWSEAIKRANKKIAYYHVTNIRIIEGVAESVPLGNNSVDLIVSNNGINNVNDMNQVLSECSRISKPGSQFVLTMNLDKSMFEFYGELERVLTDLQMHNEISLMRQHIYQKRRPLDEVISMLHKHGFTIKDLEHDQFNYKFANGTALFNHFFIRLAFIDAWLKFIPENKAEQIFDRIESRLNKQAEILGGIKLSIPFIIINSIKNLT